MERLNVFNYVVNSADDHLDVYIDGVIVDASTQQILKDWWGDETSVSFKSIRDQVNKSGKRTINFYVNSYGGHVGDAMAIHDWIQQLESQGFTITTNGVGMICSAATYILSASKNSRITKNSWYMIHNVSGGVYGDVTVIENYAKTMRKFNDTIVNFYAELTGKDSATVENWMSQETWFTGVEAVDNGFVKNLDGEQPFKNAITPDVFPFKNKAAMNAYNACVAKPDNLETFLNTESNMNKLVESLINGLKKHGVITDNAGETPKPLTEEVLTNAFTEAFKDFDINAMIDNRLNELFKDGLPENIQTALGTAMNAEVTEGTKNFVTNETFKKLQDDVKDVENKVAANAGGATPRNGKQQPAENEKYAHEGVTFGNGE